MSDGISPNPLNDITKVYLNQISALRDKEVEKDINRWSEPQSQPRDITGETYKEEVKGQDTEMRKVKAAERGTSADTRNPKDPTGKHYAKGQKGSIDWWKNKTRKEGFSSWRTEMREVVDQDVAGFLDRPETEKEFEKEVKEKKVKNKVEINPKISEAIKNIGGKVLSVKEQTIDPNSTVVDHGNAPNAGTHGKPDAKERRQSAVKRQILMKKMQALRAGAGSDVQASYEPEGEMVEGLGVALGAVGGGLAAAAGGVAGGAIKGAGSIAAAAQQAASKNVAQAKKERARQQVADKQAQDIKRAGGVAEQIEAAVEYFYEEGINEAGIDLLIEEIGLEEFVDFVDGGAVDLNEERAARRASVRAKSYEKVKAEVDKADAAKKKAKKGEYAPSYAKKETDVTVYDDDKPAAKKAPAGMKKAVARKKEVLTQPVKKAAPKPVAKKVQKAVTKVKSVQPKKRGPASKQGLRDKITTAYKAGVKRHKKAVQPARVFAKGMKAGAKSAVKFAGKAKKAVVGEKLDYDPMKDPDFDPIEAEKNRGVSGKNNPKKGKKLKDLVKESGWHRRNPEKVGTSADPDFNVLKGKGKPVKDSKPATTGKASKQPPGIYKPNKEGKFVKVDEAKADTGSAEAKASARNVRNTPPGKDSKFDTSVFITRKPGESLDSARTRKRREAHAKKRGVKEDKAFDNVVSALRKKHGKDAVITKDSPKPKAKPLNAKQIWRKDDRTAIQREIDAQYGRTPWNKKGSLGT